MVAILAPDLASIAFITVHMRQADKDEIYNVTGHNNPFILAQQTLDATRMGSGVVAHRGGKPAGVLGFCPLRPGVCNCLAYGTNAFPTVALSLTKYAIRVMRPALIAAGFHRVECQSRHDHIHSHQWLEMLGFRREAVLRCYGSDGSDYFQYAAIREWFKEPGPE